MSKLARFFVIICLACFIAACVIGTTEGVAANANEICGWYCSGITSPAAYVKCAWGCLEWLR